MIRMIILSSFLARALRPVSARFTRTCFLARFADLLRPYQPSSVVTNSRIGHDANSLYWAVPDALERHAIIIPRVELRAMRKAAHAV